MRSLILSTTVSLCLGGSMAPAQTVNPLPGQSASETPVLSPVASSLAEAPRVLVVHLDNHPKNTATRWWIASMFAVAGASGFDAATSWGKYEGNSLLASSNGRFGAKGLSIKVGITGAVLLPQLLLHKQIGLHKIFAIANFGEAAGFSAVAAHNLGVSRPAN